MKADIITFEARASFREIAKLGVWEIGYVYPSCAGGSAWYTVDLPGIPNRPHPVASLVMGKRMLVRCVSDWLEGAGAPFADHARAARQQMNAISEVERAS